MDLGEYERMYRLEDHLWWYAGMQAISRALLDSALLAGNRHGDFSLPVAAADLQLAARSAPTDDRSRRSPLRILDAGCGTGGAAVWLAHYGEVTALDWSSDALAFCRQRRLPRLCRGSVMALPFATAAFDLVTAFDVVYHLAVADDVAALRELCRVLRPGGIALVRVPAFEFVRSGHDAAVHTRERYRRPQLIAKLRSAGFSLRRATYANTVLFPLAAGRRLVQRGLGRHAVSDVQPVHPTLNRLFGGVLRLEARLLRHRDLPFGLSLLALVSKPCPAPVATNIEKAHADCRQARCGAPGANENAKESAWTRAV